MSDLNFEGSLILEKLAEVGVLDDFFEAVDSDNFENAKRLLKSADIDSETISWVLSKMQEADGEH
ncbi:MAG: hypothetical protein CL677_02285 [Bdellovibrionaceae bacterium]|nr:hypothetical protein [Pseudobdellovibrionaceae bacterium]|tara:strand:+ start:269 stop:463 length:195 start_codon:yes stop_codon:yes gene_type:complete